MQQGDSNANSPPQSANQSAVHSPQMQSSVILTSQQNAFGVPYQIPATMVSGGLGYGNPVGQGLFCDWGWDGGEVSCDKVDDDAEELSGGGRSSATIVKSNSSCKSQKAISTPLECRRRSSQLIRNLAPKLPSTLVSTSWKASLCSNTQVSESLIEEERGEAKRCSRTVRQGRIEDQNSRSLDSRL